MKKFKGIITALVTPFQNGEIDFTSLEKLILFQLKNDISGFVINGTTGESPTLKKKEKKEIFTFVKSKVPKDFPLIMGTGSNSTEETKEAAKEAEKMGADAQLVVVPYYNKPPQRGLLEHFKAVAEAAQIPSILYNVPSRTITGLELETIKKLSEHPQIIGIKEASGNIEFAKDIRKNCGESFILLSGDDGSYDEFMEAGGDGVISVSSHIIPKEMAQKETRIHKDLIDHLFIEANPIPIKKALHLMGIIQSPECRLPLVELSEINTIKLSKIMRTKGLIS